MKLTQRLISSVAPALLLVVLGLALVFYNYAQQDIEYRARVKLETYAHLQVERIREALERDRERLQLITSRTRLRKLMERHNRQPSSELVAEIQTILGDAMASVPDIRSIALYGSDTALIAQVGEALPVSQELERLPLLRQAGSPTFDVVASIDKQPLLVAMDGAEWSGKFVGSVLVVFDMSTYSAIALDVRADSQTGETLWAKQASNGDALFLSDLRFDAGAAFNRQVSGFRLDVPITRALLGERGFIREAVDYRDVPVLAYTDYIESAGWGLVVKMDRAEALASMPQLRMITLTGVVLLLGGVFVALVVVSRSITRPLNELTERVRDFSGNDLSGIEWPDTKDEVALLEHAYGVMEQRISEQTSRLEKEVADKTAEIQRTLERARSMNQSLMEARRRDKLSGKRLQLALEASLSGHWEWSPEDPETVWLSGHGMEMLGFDDKSGRLPLNELAPLMTAEAYRTLISEAVRAYENRSMFDLEVELSDETGPVRWIRVRGAVSKDDTHGDVRMAGANSDITAIKMQEQEAEQLMEALEQRAKTDSLTGLANRHYLSEILEYELDRSIRDPAARLSCMVLDIDYFKQVNDTHGHLTGDDILAAVGQVLRTGSRPADLPTRFGGEEFVVLLPEIDVEGARVIAERLRTAISNLKIKNREGAVVPVTASFGVAQWHPGESDSQFLARADAALLQAKQAGRDCVLSAESTSESVSAQA